VAGIRLARSTIDESEGQSMTAVVWALGLTGAALVAGPAAATPQQAGFFESRVRPVLAERCWRCHGPAKQMGGLRLDSRAAVLKGGDEGPAVRPGDPKASLLVRAIRRTGELKMPPKKALRDIEIDALAAWVKMGAPWPATAAVPVATWRRHWAFHIVRETVVPRVRDASWVRTSIDPFVLARLEAAGLTPSPEADRRTLIRRVTIDLIGLPPTPAEVTAFEADQAAGAYERLVDRLLASPHYGERWGRHWLDVARYADTKGYVFFEESAFPWAWTYRDWVVRALNEDMGYDQFLLRQLAADQLPGCDRRDLPAMGFLTAGGRFMNNVHDILDDRIDVVCRGLMGLTVGCARCHDHKFDPIPTADYYSLYGVFASSTEPEVPPLFAEPPRTPQYEAFRKELARREAKLAEFLHGKYLKVTDGARRRAGEYLLAAHRLRDQPAIDDFMLLADGGELNPFMLKRWQAFLAHTRKVQHPVFIPWHALAALPTKDFAVRAAAVCRQLASPRPGGQRVNTVIVRSLATKPPANMAEVARCYGQALSATALRCQETLRRAATAGQAPPAGLSDPEQEELRQVLWGPQAPPDVHPDLINRLDLLPDRPAQAELQKFLKAVEDWRANGPGAPPRAMVLVDAPRPYEPHVFVRGNPANIGPAVPRQLPAILAGPDRRPFRYGSGRLELARAVVDPKNPLTARVLANRVWMHHFGKPLVATPGDFGLRGEPPTHPELLDHLATVFVLDGWSLKKLHRRIVLSAAYRQTSADRPKCRQTDPANRSLWRAERRRLDFESLRDALLAVSGRLDPTLGGKPVPEPLSASARRRTLYGQLDRLHVPGLYRSFDFPSPDATAPQRDYTTTPQQTLFLMNHPFVLECARSLASRPEVAAEPDFARKVAALYRLAYGRDPLPEEVALPLQFLGGTADLAAWARYAQGLLMANEFAFVD
jgi:hypothetical protein